MLADATALFRAVSVSSLRAADFASSGVAVGASTSAAAAAVSTSDSAVGLGERSYKAKLGEIDAFLSHWRTRLWPSAKYEALERWAAAHEAKARARRSGWTRCASIRTTSTPNRIACPSSSRVQVELRFRPSRWRLSRIMEIFTYIQMTRGIADEQIAVVPIGEGTALEGIKESFRSFRGEKAECFKQSDREKMLGVIEASFGDFVDFNKAVRGVFSRAERAGPDADAVAHDVRGETTTPLMSTRSGCSRPASTSRSASVRNWCHSGVSESLTSHLRRWRWQIELNEYCCSSTSQPAAPTSTSCCASSTALATAHVLDQIRVDAARQRREAALVQFSRMSSSTRQKELVAVETEDIGLQQRHDLVERVGAARGVKLCRCEDHAAGADAASQLARRCASESGSAFSSRPRCCSR